MQRSQRDPYRLAEHAAQALAEMTGVTRHDVVIVLGSGWSGAADALGETVAEFDLAELPGFLAPVAEGHPGRVRSSLLSDATERPGLRVLTFLGRTHLYEGHGPGPVAHPIRTAAAAGCRIAVLTNANGSLQPQWGPGTGVLISDHLNLSGTSALVGPRFVDLSGAWSARLRELARQVDPALVEGVYAMLPGPHYETVAEALMLRTLGADVIGMSTVVEAIAAREAGLELLGLSVVTAVEGGDQPLDGGDVVAVAASAASRLAAVIAAVLVRAGAAREAASAADEEDDHGH